jgi:hypothetical protein
MLPLLIIHFPWILATALFVLFAVLAFRRARRGLHPSRVLSLATLGLVVTAASQDLGFYLAMGMWIALRSASHASWDVLIKGLRSIPTLPAPGYFVLPAWVAWVLAAALLGMRIALRGRHPGAHGAWIDRVAQRPAGPLAWFELTSGLAALLLFWRFVDWTGSMVLDEWQAIFEGRSWLEFRAETAPQPLVAVSALRVSRLELAPSHAGDTLYALALDQDGRLWEWHLFGGSLGAPDSITPIEGPGPVLAFHFWGGTPCFFGEDRQLECAPVTPERKRMTLPVWSGKTLRSFAATRASVVPSRLCAVAEDGEGRCWDDRDRPATVFGAGLATVDPDFRSAGCAVQNDGSVYCRRAGAAGNARERVEGVEGAVSLSANEREACAVSQDGSLRCWGGDGACAVDDGRGAGAWKSTPLLSGLSVDAVAVGPSHTCALAAGKVLCWGDNTWGELCDGSTRRHEKPETIRGLSDAVSLAVGFRRTCIVRAGGGVMCCGITRRY